MSPKELLSQLPSKLTSLSDERFVQVIWRLEHVSYDEAVRRVLDDARSRIRVLRPPRLPTVKRVFCMPFEDLLTSSESATGTRVPRSLIAAVFALLQGEGAAVELGEVQRRFRDVPELSHVAELSRRIWRIGTEILSKVLADPAAADRLARYGIVAAQHAVIALIRDALAAAEPIEAFKHAVPARPVPSVEKIGAQLAEAMSSPALKPGLAAVFLLVVAARCAKPGELVAYLRQTGLPLGGQPLGEVCSRLLAASVETLASVPEALGMSEAELTPSQVAEEATSYAEQLASVIENLPPSERTTVMKQLLPVCDKIKDKIRETIVAGAIEMILPGNGAGAPDLERMKQAEERARALRRCSRVPQELSVKEVDVTVAKLSSAIEADLARAASAKTDPAAPATDIFAALRLIELLKGSAEAQRLWASVRRSAASSGDRAA